MLKKLTLENFKNFRHAELELGPFTVLIGANATGKSNIREAFRFLHGIGRDYTIFDIIGEKWVEGGVHVWQGIRGDIKEISFANSQTFSIQTECLPHIANDPLTPLHYAIFVEMDEDKQKIVDSQEFLGYDDPSSHGEWKQYQDISQTKSMGAGLRKFSLSKLAHGIQTHEAAHPNLSKMAASFDEIFASMRFYNFSPDAMRIPSTIGQTILGDRGENLSSVLYSICQDPQQKRVLLSWVEELPEMDIINFEFPTDQIGRILLTTVESNGQRISAYSLSDGTLRFLAMLAAFLGPDRARFYFFEELENGIHPTRLHLLTQFIENQVAEGDIQVVTTTHSPLLLNYLKPETLEYASLLYRLEDQPDAHIKRIVDIPDARRLIEKQSVMRLYESGWFEDAVFFMDDEEPTPNTEAIA